MFNTRQRMIANRLKNSNWHDIIQNKSPKGNGHSIWLHCGAHIITHVTYREKKQFIYKPNKQGIRYWPRKKDMCVLVIISYIGDIPIHGVVLRIKGNAVIKGRNINHVGFSLCAWETAIHLLTHSDKNIEIHAI